MVIIMNMIKVILMRIDTIIVDRFAIFVILITVINKKPILIPIGIGIQRHKMQILNILPIRFLKLFQRTIFKFIQILFIRVPFV